MRSTYLASIFLAFFCHAKAQTKSPDAFLGYELGSRFTPHHRVVAYFEHVASLNEGVSLEYYGESVEYRPLVVAFVSANTQAASPEQIREDNLRRAGLLDGEPKTEVPVTWLSYNVHGNEAVSSEAAMMTLYALVDPEQPRVSEWLQNTLVVIDPCLNPDGHERYVNWYMQKAHRHLQPDPQSMEHQEPWPSGRPNHYLFDLNRDWVWQTQQESRYRMALYNRWLPQVHVDFHEMGIDDPYYFAPAAEPLHEQLSPFQVTFQEWFGRNTAAYFDQENWFYYTKENFDLLYPSYGDTYPMYSGAIGMTIEQGGSGRAGLAMLNALGDTVTLAERILHHHTTALSAIETTSKHAKQVVDEYANFFRNSRSRPKSSHQTFVVRASNLPARVQPFLDLLDRNGIWYGRGGISRSLTGFHYLNGSEETFSLQPEDIVISTNQPKSVLAQVLLEPETVLTDSLTYDITTWALPYAFNLEAYAVKSRFDPNSPFEKEAFVPNEPDPVTLAYLAPWNATVHARFLSELLQAGIRVRTASSTFRLGDTSYPAGTLIIARGGNERIADFHRRVTDLANRLEIRLGKTTTGFVDAGRDFGSSAVRTVSAPKIALVGGEKVNSLNLGELWHYFEQELEYPISILDHSRIPTMDLTMYDVIVLPSGNYGSLDQAANKQLNDWVHNGGRLIALEGALGLFVDQEGYGLKTYRTEAERIWRMEYEEEQPEWELTIPFQERERLQVSEQVIGAVLQVQIDGTHPLGYGLTDKYFTLKNSSERYSYLGQEGVNVGYIPSLDHHRAGFIGYKAKPKLESSLVFGVENLGKGSLVYLVDNPLFRGFWESGKLLMANAVFIPNPK
ncbi:Peptidase M14, carboxypeptidase A precursor [Lunatimonas lonarensis]|uniref:Peptidase M14, carboxypeptidase A n=1 Tax=Lunatimonas lonarensis TaxID=1232681 RepID=R7ZTE1_9BACT|nr:M14 family metallopeptidase [Lunatimonas lonarensis]EON77352.1 Peptidase M14, carboxypeptidase A precursor [Lunatimonas lonarensis]